MDKTLPIKKYFKMLPKALPFSGFSFLAATALPIYGLAMFRTVFINLFQAVIVPSDNFSAYFRLIYPRACIVYVKNVISFDICIQFYHTYRAFSELCNRCLNQPELLLQ